MEQRELEIWWSSLPISEKERIARKGLADTRLVAPVGGVIGRKFVGTGETALPSQAVVTILDISSVKVKVAVPEAEMGAIRPTTSSIVSVEAANVRAEGGRIEKGVQADALTHTYDVRVHVANTDRRLLPGMVASVTFGTDAAPTGQITLPVTSVQCRADGSLFVWTVDNAGRAHRTSVTTGQTIGNRIAITGGLAQGQHVVTEGYQKLSEGTQTISNRQ